MIKDRVLNVAIDHFGRLGFDGASTRAIAKSSRTTMSSITYHFGGKRGLYLAAADSIVEAIITRQSVAIEKVAAQNITTRNDAIFALLDLLDSFAEMMLSEDSASWARFIIREQFEPTDAFERIWTGIMSKVIAIFVRLMEKICIDLDVGSHRSAIIFLLGQAIALRAARASICRLFGSENIGSAEIAILRSRLRTNSQIYLEQIGALSDQEATRRRLANAGE